MGWADLPLDRPVATTALLISLMVLGAVGLIYIPLDYFPMVKEPEIDISVPFPGSHPLEALNEVVRPLEEEIATIPNIKRMFSSVRANEVEIEVQFSWASNIDVKRMEVREAVDRARERLPDQIGHVRVEGDVGGPGDGAILQGRIAAVRDLSESWDLLDRRMKRPLERVPGVARVDLYGVEPQEVRVDLDLDALRLHGVQPQTVLDRLNAANLDLDLGSVRGDVLRYDIRSLGGFRDLNTIRGLSLGTDGLRVADVARVEMLEPVLDYGRHLDGNFAIGIDVFKEATANTVETVDRLMERIAEIEQDPQLQGVQLLVWENAGEQIVRAIRGLRDAGLFGGLLAITMLYLFLRQVRTTLIVAVAIPFSLLVTCGAMYLIGIKLDVLSMLGLMLGVGMLVDNAVVVIENIHRLQGLGLPARDAARRGTRQVGLAVAASTATTLIVWSWILVTERSPMTIYIGIFAGVICLSVACSLLISLTFIPMAASRMLARARPKAGFLHTRVLPRYRRLLAWTLKHRVVTLCLLLGLALTAAVPITLINKSGDTREQQRDVTIFYQIADPTPKAQIEAYVTQVEQWLASRSAELEYESTYSWFREPHDAQTRVFLPKEKGTEVGIRRLRSQLEGQLPVIAGVKLEVTDRDWWRRGAEDKVRVSVALHGEDPEFLEELAARAEAILRRMPEAVEVFGPSLRDQKELRLRIDSEKASAMGVSPSSVADAVRFAFRGQQLRRFKGEHGEVRLVMGLPEELKSGMASLKDLPVPRETAEPIPLNAVAQIEMARVMPSLRRVDRQTTSHVSVEFDKEKVNTAQARDLVSQSLAGFSLPEGYSWDFGQWGQDHDMALGIMLRGVILSLIVVLMLMAALFESVTQPLAILITLPLAFFGSFWALWLLGFDLDVLAFLGVILLIGLVVNNGIVMVDHVNALRREGRPRIDALVEGCGDRLRPVLMTALTTFFGLTPLAFSSFTVAGVYIDSMAVAIIGGLASSTVFTLIALPVWYTTVEDLGRVLADLLPRRVTGRDAAPATGAMLDGSD